MRRRPHPNNQLEARLLGLPISLSISLDIPVLDPLLSPLTAGNKPQTSNNAHTQTPASSPTPAPPPPPPPSPSPAPAPATEPEPEPAPTPGSAPAPPSTPLPAPGDTPAITAPAQASPSPQPTPESLPGGGVQTSVNVGGENNSGGASQTSPQGSAPLSDGPPSSARFNVNPNDSDSPFSSPGAVPTSRSGTSKSPSASDRAAPTFAGKSSEPLALGSASLIAAVNVQSAPLSVDPNPFATADAQPTGSSGSHKGPNAPGSGSGGGGDGGSGGNDDPGSGSSGNFAHHGLSKGAIAAIAVIAALVALIVLFFLLRRSSISKRTARRQRWFKSASKFGQSASSNEVLPRNRNSNGSSFVTNIDRGQRPPSDLLDASWPPPEMVQNFPAALQLPISVPPVAPSIDSPVSPVIRTRVTGSDDDPVTFERSTSQLSQYLVIPVMTPMKASSSVAVSSLPSPMSVRPFSPSEAWQFPQPPQDDLRRQSQLILSANKSMASVVTTANQSRFSMSTSEEYMTATDAASEPQNPFADLASVDTHETHYTTLTDTTDASHSDHFDEIEIIRRPFVPNLGDELAVAPGDEIRVRKRFDDGWAYAEKVKDGARGLFPIDCLRMENQELPAFLAARRISNYVTDPFSDPIVI